MQRLFLLSALLAGRAAVSSACVIPSQPPSNTITQGFGIQVRNQSYPLVHNHYMHLFESGGGDQHLFLDPPGTVAWDLTLDQGIIKWPGPPTAVHAVINREVRLPAASNTRLSLTIN